MDSHPHTHKLALTDLIILLSLLALPFPAVSTSVIMCSATFSAIMALRGQRWQGRLALLDICALLILLSVCISMVAALYRPTAVSSASLLIVSCNVYFYARSSSDEMRRWLLRATAITLCLYCALGSWMFLERFWEWSKLGFIDLVDFRAYVNAHPSYVNSAGSGAAYLIGMSLSIVALKSEYLSRPLDRVFIGVQAVLCFICILLSFSRVAYLSLGLGLLAFLVLTRSLRWRLIAVTACALPVIGLSLCSRAIAQAMLDTVRAFSTESQIQSARGRMEAAMESIELFKARPFVGAGPGNFALVSATAAGRGDALQVSQPYNAAITIAIEDGAIGLVAFGAVWFALLRSVWRHCHKCCRLECGGYVFGLVAIALFSSLDSSLLADRTAVSLCSILFALIKSKTSTNTIVESYPTCRICDRAIGIFLGSAAALALPFLVDVEIRNVQLRHFKIGFVRKDIAWDYINTPFHTPDSYVEFANALEPVLPPSNGPDFFQIYTMRSAPNTERRVQVQRAIDEWTTVMRRFPEDDGAQENLAHLYGELGRFQEALIAADRATSLNLDDSSHLVTDGILNEACGRVAVAFALYVRAISRDPRIIMSPFWSYLAERRPDITGMALAAAIHNETNDYRGGTNLHGGLSLARLLWLHGEATEAQRILEAVLSRLPTLSGGWELEGEIYAARGDVIGSIQCFERAAFLQPDDPLPRERIASLALSSDDLALASQEAVRAFQLRAGLRTQHSLRMMRMYHLLSPVPNDSVPSNWLRYLAPISDFHELFVKLSARYSQRRQPDEAMRFRQLAHLTAVRSP